MKEKTLTRAYFINMESEGTQKPPIETEVVEGQNDQNRWKAGIIAGISVLVVLFLVVAIVASTSKGTEEPLVPQTVKQGEIGSPQATIPGEPGLITVHQATAPAPFLVLAKEFIFSHRKILLAASILLVALLATAITASIISERKRPAQFAADEATKALNEQKHLEEQLNRPPEADKIDFFLLGILNIGTMFCFCLSININSNLSWKENVLLALAFAFPVGFVGMVIVSSLIRLREILIADIVDEENAFTFPNLILLIFRVVYAILAGPSVFFLWLISSYYEEANQEWTTYYKFIMTLEPLRKGN
jgi:hypothetical protein